MLNKSEKNTLIEILVAERDIARENIIQLNKVLQPVSPDNAIGRLSRMDALEMQSVNTTKLGHQQQRVHHIERALKAIQTDKNFGLCLECNQAINIERLKLTPESRYCVSCLDAR